MSIERINTDLCNGCGLCVNTCPMDVLRLDKLVSEREEYPPCRQACPAGLDIRSFMNLLKMDMIDEAMSVLRDALPLPAVTGRICPHPCELDCARREVDGAVNINSVERFVADYWLQEKAQPVRKIYSAKVAVVGSGPAGLTAAYELAKMGYPVTVFESLPVLGGMLRVGVPEYRLPRDVLDAQINYIGDTGVEFKTNATIGKDMTLEDLKKEGYQAVFFSIGAQLSKRIDLEGIELDGVLCGLDFLRSVNLETKAKAKDKLTVIGGGSVAINVALTALRLGAKEVQVACLESREQMPAYEDEIQQAVDEGVILNLSWGPSKILGDGKKVKGIELVKCISVFDQDGKFNPSYDGKVIKTIETNMVIFAIGQISDLSLIPQGVKTTKDGTIQVDPVSLETALPGIFAGGDATQGPGLAIQAIADGKRAAISIDRHLRGESLKKERGKRPKKVGITPNEGIEKLIRQATPLLPIEERLGNFKEVKTGFNIDAMMWEVRRCMTCGSRAIIRYPEDCMLCLYCERDCPQKAIYVSPTRTELPLLAWG